MPTLRQTDDMHALVVKARIEPGAFAAIYDRYVSPVFRYHYSRVGNTPDAEDLTAQTFLSALEALPRYRERGTFAAWLFTIARSKVMDHFRCKDPDPLSKEQPAQADLTAQVEMSDETARLASLIRTLDDREQELIRLRFVADLSYPEMAALLGKKEEAVKKNLYRLLARLKSQMEVVNVR